MVLSFETLNGIFSLELLKLRWSVLIYEFVYTKITSTDTDFDLVFVNSDMNFLGSENVNTLIFSHKPNLELFSVRIVVDVFCKLSVDIVSLDWNIYCNSFFEVDDILL